MLRTITGWLVASVIFYMMAWIMMLYLVPAIVWAIQMTETGSIVWGPLGVLSLGASSVFLHALVKAGVITFKRIAV